MPSKKITLGSGFRKAISVAVDRLFDRVKTRFFSRPPVDKRVHIGFKPRVTMTSLFETVNREESNKPNYSNLDNLLDIAGDFIESQRHHTRAHVVKAVEAWINKARDAGVKTDVETVLGGELAEVWKKAYDGMYRIVNTEANVVKNIGAMDAIIKVNQSQGIDDPTVYFISVKDQDRCDECTRLHTIDGTTPRLWKLSQVGTGYHKKGDSNPKIAGLHPNCRCSSVTLLPGYSFDASGAITFKSLGYDEYAVQQGLDKAEILENDLIKNLEVQPPVKPRKLRLKTPKEVKQDEPNLVVTHNLSAQNLAHAAQLGGLATPSMAVSHKDHPLEGFGDISLVAHPDLINPEHDVPVFGSDVYSPRHPRAKYKVNDSHLGKFRKWFKPYAERAQAYTSDLEGEINRGGWEGAASGRDMKTGLGLAYLEEKHGHRFNDPIEPKRIDKEWVRAPAFREFVAKHGINHNFDMGDDYHKALSAASKQAITQHHTGALPDDPEMAKDLIDADVAHHFDGDDTSSDLALYGRTNSILRSAGDMDKLEVNKYKLDDQVKEKMKEHDPKDFENWVKDKLGVVQGESYIPKYTNSGERKIPYNLENVLKEVTKKIRQGEDFNYGLGTARAAGSKRFKSLAEIQKARSKVSSKEEFNKTKENMDQRFGKLVDGLRSHNTFGGGEVNTRSFEGLSEAIGESYKKGRSLRAELGKSGFKDVPAHLLGQVADFASDLLTMPTEYFEAKPQRIVRLHEFQGAAVPHDIDPQHLHTLRQQGVTHIEHYDRNKPGDRARAIQKIAGEKKLMLSEMEYSRGPKSSG